MTVKKSTQLVNDWGTKLHERDLRNPDVRFYAEANPAYVQGHGLITIGFVTLQDFIAVIKKYLDRYTRWAATKLMPQSSKKKPEVVSVSKQISSKCLAQVYNLDYIWGIYHACQKISEMKKSLFQIDPLHDI